ncbi:MAG: hypothetical protein ACKVRN_12600 [Pyrinomonadaceae bacterium]
MTLFCRLLSTFSPQFRIEIAAGKSFFRPILDSTDACNSVRAISASHFQPQPYLSSDAIGKSTVESAADTRILKNASYNLACFSLGFLCGLGGFA